MQDNLTGPNISNLILVPTNEAPKRKSLKFWVIGGFVVIILVGGLIANYVYQQKKSVVSRRPNPTPDTTSVIVSPSPTPSPIPFYELTIPYLRERQYESSLADLQKLSENQSFTSYLTSYDSDGFKVNGLLTIPKGDEGTKYPAIVFVHGYIPPKQYQTTQNYAAYVNFLARNGFVVFKIDLRGHGSSEGEASGGYYSSDYVIDILNAYAALQKSEFVDPQKIGLWGHSMSGNLVMRSLAAKPDIPAVIIWAGAVYTYLDFNEYGITDNSYRAPDPESESVKKRLRLMETYGSPSDGNPFWQLVAPTNYLEGITGSIEIHHAVNDNVVSIEYSRNLMSILDKTAIPHQLHEYPSGGHNISGDNFTPAMQKTVEFFQNNLKD